MSWAVWLAIGIVVWFAIACWLSYVFTRALSFEPPSNASLADIELWHGILGAESSTRRGQGRAEGSESESGSGRNRAEAPY